MAELLARMSGEELADWMAYEELRGPLGPTRGDWQAAVISSTVASTIPRRKGRARPKVADFLLKWKGSRSARQSAAESEAIGRELAKRVGGTWEEAPDRKGVSDVDH